MSPSRKRKVRNVKAGFSLIPVFRITVFFWLMAWAEMASARVMLARTFPTWRVLSKHLHSRVPR